jgi:FHS family Na+ dependent glucose MFS transporter 1
LGGLAENTGTNLSQLGILFTVRSLGGLLGALLGSHLYDRTAGHPVAAAMLLAMAVALFLTPLVPLLWLLCLVMFAFGFAESTLDLGVNTLILWVHGHAVPPFMNALHFFYGAGAALSPLIVAQAILWTQDIQWAYWTLAFLLVPVAIGLLRLPSPSVRRTTPERENRRVDHILVGLIMLFLFLYVGAEIAFGGWIFTFAVRSVKVDEPTAAYLTSAFWGAFTVGRLLGIPVAARLRPRTTLCGSIVGTLLGLGLLALWPSSLPVAWVGAIGVGLSMASIFPAVFSLAERRVVVTGRISGLLFTGISLGAMSIPWLVGRLVSDARPQAMMWCLLAVLALDLAVLLALLLRSDRHQPPQKSPT